MKPQTAASKERPRVSISNRGKLYVYLIFLLGAAAIATSLYQLQRAPLNYQWLILAALTLISGSATVRVPSIPATVSVSETFVFTAVLLFGIPAGTLTVALDSLVISFWLSRRKPEPLRLLFNLSAPALSIWLGANVFYLTSGVSPLVEGTTTLGEIALPLLLFTIVYFLTNSGLTALVVHFDRGGSPFQIWTTHFRWLSLNYFGGASLAALIAVYTRDIDLVFIAILVPLLLVLYFTFRTSMARVEDANRHLADLNTLHLSTIETLAMAIDAKDQTTHGHIRRVQHYATTLASAMGITEPKALQAIEAASLLHDMGKLAVPEHILNKPGPLTDAERSQMERHASIGAEILSEIDFPYPVVPIVRHHHENWDGNGYPDGISGTDIPIGARILSVVDCFDALTSDRPYRPRISADEAFEILCQRSGSMYDPSVVSTFRRIHDNLTRDQADASTFDRRAFTEISASALPEASSQSSRPRTEDSVATNEELQTAYDLGRALGADLPLSKAAETIFGRLECLLPVSTVVFYLYDSLSDSLVARHVSGNQSDTLIGLTLRLGEHLSGWVGAHRQTISNADPRLDLGDRVLDIRPMPRSCLSVPLLEGDTLVGVLGMYSSTENAFTDGHKRVSEALAGQIAQTIRNATRCDQVGPALCLDAATGLPNAEQLCRFFTAKEESDAFGHDVVSLLLIRVTTPEMRSEREPGLSETECLKMLIVSIQGRLRTNDRLFRLSEGELVALLPETSATAARSIASRMRHIGGAMALADGGLPLGVKIGIATASPDDRRLDGLLQSARRQSRANAFISKRDFRLVAR